MREAIAIVWSINDPPGLQRLKTGIGEVIAIVWTINDPPGLQGLMAVNHH